MTYYRSVVFSEYSSFLHQLNWPPRYNWNIVESGIKHHNPNPNSIFILIYPGFLECSGYFEVKSWVPSAQDVILYM